MILGREPLFIFYDKTFSYTFSQMVSLSGVRPDTLRYYEQVGFIKNKRDDKGYRYKFVAKTHRLAYGIKATFFDLNLTYIRYIIYV